MGTSEQLLHTFCFFVLHPLQAPLIREGILFSDLKSCWTNLKLCESLVQDVGSVELKGKNEVEIPIVERLRRMSDY
jgi:hypothetical protein